MPFLCYLTLNFLYGFVWRVCAKSSELCEIRITLIFFSGPKKYLSKGFRIAFHWFSRCTHPLFRSFRHWLRRKSSSLSNNFVEPRIFRYYSYAKPYPRNSFVFDAPLNKSLNKLRISERNCFLQFGAKGITFASYCSQSLLHRFLY